MRLVAPWVAFYLMFCICDVLCFSMSPFNLGKFCCLSRSTFNLKITSFACQRISVAVSQLKVRDEQDYDEDNYDNDEEEKFQIAIGEEENTDAPLPPLPSFYGDEDLSTLEGTSAWTADNAITTSAKAMKQASANVDDSTQKQIEQQQQQIDVLMKLVQSQTATAEPAGLKNQLHFPLLSRSVEMEYQDHINPNRILSSVANQGGINVAPLKAMLFIDGTWLYYSIHGRRERDCPIVQKYGRGWQYRYKFDWTVLPRIVCEQMQQQQAIQGWSSSIEGEQPRPVEIVRASVYSSMKNTTDKTSFRGRMYQNMADANYDIHMMTTTGKGEKCVDIQLAVEMLHYATVPNAYDVAILLSGDKDFMPALIRTRQKGRQVAILAMRTGCNRALYETPNAKDYEVIWIEDYLDRLLVPIPKEDQEYRPESIVSRYTLSKVLYDFIAKSGLDRVSSRDVGRYLKFLNIGDRNMLQEVKIGYGGLFQFIIKGSSFEIAAREDKKGLDTRDKSYWVSVKPNAKDQLIMNAKETKFHPTEKDFFGTYSLKPLEQPNQEKAYFHSINPNESNFTTPVMLNYEKANEEVLVFPKNLTQDYSKDTVVQLKQLCRGRGLPVSGSKAILLERVRKDVEEEAATLLEQHTAKKAPKCQKINGDHVERKNHAVDKYLEGLLQEYLQASGGQASSRDVGRYLAANSASGASSAGQVALPGQRLTALSELKNVFQSLASYVNSRNDLFEVQRDEEPGTSDSNYSFQIVPRNKSS